MVINIKGLELHLTGIDGEPDFNLVIEKLTLELGKMVYIMGHNGSGKSLLLKLLAGELRPSHKNVEISLGDQKWKAKDRASCIVRQKAEESLAIDLTVRENLLLRYPTTSILDKLFPKLRLKGKITEYLKQHSRLLEKIDQPVANLSGGQVQTLAFLGATISNSELLFLDEFLSSTDFDTQNLLLGLAKKYAANVPACVLIVSHDIDLALKEADRIIILKEGSLYGDIYPENPDWNSQFLEKALSIR